MLSNETKDKGGWREYGVRSVAIGLLWIAMGVKLEGERMVIER